AAAARERRHCRQIKALDKRGHGASPSRWAKRHGELDLARLNCTVRWTQPTIGDRYPSLLAKSRMRLADFAIRQARRGPTTMPRIRIRDGRGSDCADCDSPIAATASISISQPGRAKRVTTTSVEAGGFATLT